MTSAELAGSVNTNPVIIRRLLLVLQRAKLVETCRGPGAGSRLSRSPRAINLAEVYRAVEESNPFPAPARKPNPACPVGHDIRGALVKICASARQAMERDLERTTLAQVILKVKRADARGRKSAI